MLIIQVVDFTFLNCFGKFLFVLLSSIYSFVKTIVSDFRRLSIFSEIIEQCVFVNILYLVDGNTKYIKQHIFRSYIQER